MEDVLKEFQVGDLEITAVKADHISKWFSKGAFYEAAMLDHIRDTYPKGMTIIDVGAHVGNHTLYFHKCCEAEQVLSFEPNPDLYWMLKKNLEANGLETISVFQAAVGDSAGWAVPQPWPAGNTGMATVKIMDAPHFHAVPVITLDSLEEKSDLIKIDAEGMGAAVLRGALGILRKYHPAIFIEANTKEEFIEIAGILNPLGYAVKSKWNATPTYEFV